MDWLRWFGVNSRSRRTVIEKSSDQWMAELANDIQQARRNPIDCEYVRARRARTRMLVQRRNDRPRLASEFVAAARIECEAHQYEQAERFIREAIASDDLLESGRNLAVGVMEDLGERHLFRHGSDAALSLYEFAIATSTKLERPILRARLHQCLARVHLVRHDPEPASQELSQALNILGWSHTPGDPFRDIPCFESQDPREIEIVIDLKRSLAWCDGLLLDFTLARSHLVELRTFLSMNTRQQLSVTQTEARLAAREGRYGTAERCYCIALELIDALEQEQLLTIRRIFQTTLFAELGWTYLRLGLLEEISGVAKHIQTLDPAHTHAAILRAEVYVSLKRYSEGEQWARQALANSKGTLIQAAGHRVLAECAFHLDKPTDALRLAQEAVRLAESCLPERDHELVHSLLTLAEVHIEVDPALAEATLQRALELAWPPDHPDRRGALACLAALRTRQGRTSEAETYRSEIGRLEELLVRDIGPR